MDNWPAFGLYVARLVDALDSLVEYAVSRYGEVRVLGGVPVGWQPGSAKKFQKLPMRDWLIPRQVASAVIGQFPEAKLIRPDGFGARPVRSTHTS